MANPVRRKISARSKDEISGPRRAKPLIQKERAGQKALRYSEKKLLQALSDDVKIRTAFRGSSNAPYDPLLVFRDFDHTHWFTELAPEHLPKWEELSEYAKLSLAYIASMAFQGQKNTMVMSWTAWVEEDLVDRCSAKGMELARALQQRLHAKLSQENLREVETGFVLEGRSRSGKSRTRVHAHGFSVFNGVASAALLKPILEDVFMGGLKPGRYKRAIDVQRAYVDPEKGLAAWPGYMTKNTLSRDKRLMGRRVYLSRTLTKIAKEFHGLLSDPE